MSVELRRVAAENQRIVEAGRYRTEHGDEVEVASLLAAAIKETREYGPTELTGPARSVAHRADTGERTSGRSMNPGGTGTRIEITGQDTITAARQLAASPAAGRVAVLNFASARHPGGGYLTGAKAQEEDICRKTLLHPCLLAASDYYTAHERARDPFYSHRLIYSPGVPVIRDHLNRLTAPVVGLDVITCAAPNAGVIQRYRPESVDRIPRQLVERAAVVLAAAARHGARRLVLGAWGCGVFRNDPRQVAGAFRVHLSDEGEYRDAFEHVRFAVLDRSAQQENLRAFRDAFGG